MSPLSANMWIYALQKVLMVQRLFIAAHQNPANIPKKKNHIIVVVLWYKAALI